MPARAQNRSLAKCGKSVDDIRCNFSMRNFDQPTTKISDRVNCCDGRKSSRMSSGTKVWQGGGSP
ncbi:hypothetical protein ZHAS_00000615 [Anopheles sinensis]|uniref:Uncharacterized protein n=1 Tax=Anopheles sinensis TaxID=74873 RepID=A0A084VAD5_ANOSI|nr:hypothetical protein ZHAS_00000615 [Anopheles sinensis]